MLDVEQDADAFVKLESDAGVGREDSGGVRRWVVATCSVTNVGLGVGQKVFKGLGAGVGEPGAGDGTPVR